MLNHSFGGTVYTKATTCTSDGSTYIKCGKCSATKTQSTLKATGHNYKDDSPATCIATGSKKCDKCSATVSTPATGIHSFTIKSEPETCTTNGKYVCTTCTAAQAIAATGHQFGGQVYTVGATCTAEGYTYISCTKCKTEKYKYDIKPVLNHNYDASYKSATCTETGINKCIKCGYTDTIPVLNHTFKDEYTTDASKHWKECRRCSEVTGSGAHVFNTELKCKECSYNSLIKATKVILSSGCN